MSGGFAEPKDVAPLVRVGRGAGGLTTYLVDLPPETLPPVTGRDLERAWYAAREAAISADWGEARGFRFRRADGGYLDLALADADARCWAGAVDGTVGMATCYGLSVCLRLLALVDLLGRVGWAERVVRLARDGAELHPCLLRAAASLPLTPEARFDETGFRVHLALQLGAPQLGESCREGASHGAGGDDPGRLTGARS
jgi:hypothetical protein